jgi:hypothetical protein
VIRKYSAEREFAVGTPGEVRDQAWAPVVASLEHAETLHLNVTATP